jgi:predicted GTPase
MRGLVGELQLLDTRGLADGERRDRQLVERIPDSHVDHDDVSGPAPQALHRP